jgi:hypothetical protein
MDTIDNQLLNITENDSENNSENDSEYDSEEEEAEYLREILKNKKVDEDLDNLDNILIKSNKNVKNVKAIKNTKVIKNDKLININSEIFKKDIQLENNNSKHKYYFKPKLPPIYK